MLPILSDWRTRTPAPRLASARRKDDLGAIRFKACRQAKPHKESIMLGITKQDFAIRADNFDLTQPWNLLRLIAGGFMFPHVAGKFVAGGLSVGTVGFFAKAGFTPPEAWLILAALVETATGIALVLGLCTRFAALGAAGALAVAVYALQMVKGFGWTWNTGGYEYPVFWAVVCISVAMNEFQRVAQRSSVARRQATSAARPATASA
jgi:putative oxidoreductase